MVDAYIKNGAAAGRNYVFTKLGKFIAKAHVALLFTSELSCPLADGLKKSAMGSLLQFFKAMENFSHQPPWDMSLSTGGKTIVFFCLNLDRQKGFLKSTTVMTLVVV